MARPIILTVDDDVAVSQAITRDLRSRYADRYRIVRASSGAEALATLDELAQRDLQVALIVSDHRMPEMTGIELLERSRPLTPATKRVLLTAYADSALSAESARRLSEVAPQVAEVLGAVTHTVPLRQAKARLARPDLRVAASR